jgi:hypothetical protein
VALEARGAGLGGGAEGAVLVDLRRDGLGDLLRARMASGGLGLYLLAAAKAGVAPMDGVVAPLEAAMLL